MDDFKKRYKKYSYTYPHTKKDMKEIYKQGQKDLLKFLYEKKCIGHVINRSLESVILKKDLEKLLKEMDD